MPHAADLVGRYNPAGAVAGEAKAAPAPKPPVGTKAVAVGAPKVVNDASDPAAGYDHKRHASTGTRTASSILSAAERSVGVYQMIGEKPIGKGGFGTVWRALNRTTGHTVAVKRMDLRGLNDSEIAE